MSLLPGKFVILYVAGPIPSFPPLILWAANWKDRNWKSIVWLGIICILWRVAPSWLLKRTTASISEWNIRWWKMNDETHLFRNGRSFLVGFRQNEVTIQPMLLKLNSFSFFHFFFSLLSFLSLFEIWLSLLLCYSPLVRFTDSLSSRLESFRRKTRESSWWGTKKKISMATIRFPQTIRVGRMCLFIP